MSIEVSDGSANVSKAEFTAELNNLSNLMAQSENSLYAKIDSLVSSYLTRNGISIENIKGLDKYIKRFKLFAICISIVVVILAIILILK